MSTKKEKTIGVKALQKIAREAVVIDYPAMTLIMQMKSPDYCKVRAMEELSSPSPDYSLVITLISLLKSYEPA